MTSTKKNSVIVSANFLNRNDKRKWLLRNEDEPIENAKAFNAITATNIEFTKASSVENGYGCEIVAKCEAATGSNEVLNFKKKNLTPLRFCTFFFQNANTGELVNKLKTLYLDVDGKMYGEEVEKATDTKKKKRTAETA